MSTSRILLPSTPSPSRPREPPRSRGVLADSRAPRTTPPPPDCRRGRWRAPRGHVYRSRSLGPRPCSSSPVRADGSTFGSPPALGGRRRRATRNRAKAGLARHRATRCRCYESDVLVAFFGEIGPSRLLPSHPAARFSLQAFEPNERSLSEHNLAWASVLFQSRREGRSPLKRLDLVRGASEENATPSASARRARPKIEHTPGLAACGAPGDRARPTGRG
jgi:hypothetical protein